MRVSIGRDDINKTLLLLLPKETCPAIQLSYTPIVACLYYLCVSVVVNTDDPREALEL